MTCRYTPIPKEETYILIERAQKGDEEAKARLAMDNTGLVKKIAARFVSTEHEMEDLIQIGYMGLLRAVEKFNPEFDVMFSTYAVPMIMGEIKRFFRDNGRIKVSRALKSDIAALRQAQTDFEKKEGRQPRISETAATLGISRERVLEIMEAAENLSSIVSLDQLPAGQTYGEGMQDDSGERRVDIMVMKEEIAALQEKERQVILLRYFRDLTQQQIADRLGVSQVQISRIEKRALGKIRENMVGK